jgi:hypothetical protein
MAEALDNRRRSEDAVAAYKALLRDLINLRPSGTKQRIAKSLGTHKSFISQVTNPALRVPLPAQHVETIFKICHFSPDEQRRFLDLYTDAHPHQAVTFADIEDEDHDVIRIVVPQFKNSQKRRETEDMIREFAARVIALARDAG